MPHSSENQKKLRVLVAKAVNEPELAKELVEHPEKVPAILEKHGVKLEGMTVKFVQAKPKEIVIAIPDPADVGLLAGGGDGGTTYVWNGIR